MSNKYIYFFGELGIESKRILGGKGAGLSELKKIGVPIPNGFTISAEICDYYYKHNQTYPKDFKTAVMESMKKLEQLSGKKFGEDLFVSVRSGAEVSMPGMMDTILNLGLNDRNVKILAKKTNNERFAYDAYRRLLQMFGDVVLGIEGFEEELEKLKSEKGVKYDKDLSIEDLKILIERYKELYKKFRKEFPQNPYKQLFMAIDAVFKSWNNERAKTYRKINNITGLLGTAVNIVEMVFGNMGEDSGTGVLFTRNPNTGENKIFGEFLTNAQGEDIVAGIRTPVDIEELRKLMPEIYSQLEDIKRKCERHFKDMLDIEFTIEKRKLFILQVRSGKRTALAAVKIALDLVKEKIINKKEAILRIKPQEIEQLLHKQLKVSSESKLIGGGLAASPGGAVGKVVLKSEKADEESILVRTETSAEDIRGMAVAKGFLTARGGLTSHAAVVARGMGKPAVVGCENLTIYEDKGIIEFKINNSVVIVREGEYISIDGSTGCIYLGKEELVEPSTNEDLKTFLKWCDEVKRLKVKANAETPTDVAKALEFGAEGIGLARTEHMFFNENRILSVRKMIFSNSIEERRSALKELLPMQRNDFIEILKLMKDKPVTIRLLDPPLHEFLPKTEEGIAETAKTLEISKEAVLKKISELHEDNPMLGHRGCRLAITYPEIYGMQTQAIVEAAIFVKRNLNIEPKIQIMIPIVSDAKELKIIKEYILNIIHRMCSDYKIKLNISIGTMIELPRAAIMAKEIAKEAEFFSFGTNDLTQTTLGISRDDANKFMQEYLAKAIFQEDPFKTLDIAVKKLIEITIREGKEGNPDLEIGICGEHGGDPKSIEFCHSIGMDYVSCSPYKIPIAKLVAAQCAVKEELKEQEKSNI
ncbi:MAG: pyruvate, phosphate dikinase [Candidatus Woesearchaeota archaeon]